MEEMNLSLNLLEEIDKQYEEQKEITVIIKAPTGNVETKLMIDKVFKPKKIKSCVEELIRKMDSARKMIKKQESLDEVIKMWMILLVMKYFSSLEIPSKFENQLAVMEKMVEYDIFFQIYSEFDNEQIHKVMDELDKVAQLFEARLDALEPTFKEIEEKRKMKE